MRSTAYVSTRLGGHTVESTVQVNVIDDSVGPAD